MVGKPQQPGMILAGTVQVVTPTRETRLRPKHWRMVDVAADAQADGRPDIAQVLIDSLEASLGTNPAHREAAVNGEEAVTKRIREQKRQRRLAELDRVRSLSRTAVMPRVTAGMEKMLREAELHREVAKSMTRFNAPTTANRKAIAERIALARQLEHTVAQNQDVDTERLWRHVALAETTDLARLRGERVEEEEVDLAHVVVDEHGALVRYKRGPNRGNIKVTFETVNRTIMSSRGGGLLHALKKGHLEGNNRLGPKALFVAGEIYQEAYEYARGGRSGSGEGGGGYGPNGPQVKIVEAGETLCWMRKGLSQRQIDVLDRVCGQDMRLREAARDLKAGFPATLKALREGLTKAWWSYSLAQEIGAIERVTDRVANAARIVQAIKL